MKINKVMIAGIDNNTSIQELERLKEAYPFVEWGILFSKHRAGSERYPNSSWLNEFLDSKTGMMSAHFCGAYPREILEKGDFSEVDNLSTRFDSIQLNYNFKYRSKHWKLANIIDFLKYSQAKPMLPISVILQNNKSNADMVSRFKTWQGVRVLHDASGGRGTEIKSIEIPAWDAYTGFAGGINKDNIDRICSTINLSPSDKTVWIDLESGARDENNQFSIENAERILELSSKYIK